CSWAAALARQPRNSQVLCLMLRLWKRRCWTWREIILARFIFLLASQRPHGGICLYQSLDVAIGRAIVTQALTSTSCGRRLLLRREGASCSSLRCQSILLAQFDISTHFCNLRR